MSARHTLLRWLIGSVLALATTAGAALAYDSNEYAIKATYLYKFAPFVEWPAGAAGESDRFEICIVGTDPFGRTIDEAVANQTILGRTIAVNRLGDADPVDDCQILFIGASDERSARRIAQEVAGRPILTVTDEGDAGSTGAVITFVVEDNRVRFDVDDELAAEDGLTISSKLLSLARSVQPRAKG